MSHRRIRRRRIARALLVCLLMMWPMALVATHIPAERIPPVHAIRSQWARQRAGRLAP